MLKLCYFILQISVTPTFERSHGVLCDSILHFIFSNYPLIAEWSKAITISVVMFTKITYFLITINLFEQAKLVVMEKSCCLYYSTITAVRRRVTADILPDLSI